MKTDMEVYGRTHDIKNNRYRSDSNEQRSPQTSKETREKHLLDKYNKLTNFDKNNPDSNLKDKSENFFDIEEDIKHMTLKRARVYQEIEKNSEKSKSKEREIIKSGANSNKSGYFNDVTYPPAIEIDLSSTLSYKVLEKNDSPEKVFKNQVLDLSKIQKEFQSPSVNLDEVEKRHIAVISQYESVLKILNEEFKTLMMHNEELEAKLENSQPSTQRKGYTDGFDISSDDIRRQFINEKLELQRKVEILEQKELPSLLRDKEELIHQLNHKTVIVEEIKREHLANQQKMQATEESNKQLKDELMAGKIKIDELQSKLSLIERTIRAKDDDNLNLIKEVDMCRASIQSYEQNEASIKHEVINIIHSRNQAEKECQELRFQNSEMNNIIRQLSDKLDNLSRNEAKYISEIKLCRHQIEQFENYTSALEFEKSKVEQKLKEEHETNISLQQMCTEILDELKEKQKLRKLSRENIEVERLRTKVNQSRNRLNDSIPDSMSAPKTPIEFDFHNEKPTQDKSVENYPQKSIVNEYEARKSQIIEDDPFWKNRDATQRIIKGGRISRQEEFMEERVSSRKKQKIDASGMLPAGFSSLERLKNGNTSSVKITQQRYDDVQMSMNNQNYNM